MASPSNAPSPTLTHASSEDSADLLSAYLDPAAFSETGSSIDTSLPFSGGSTEPRVVDCQQEPVSLGQQPFTFDPDGFWKYVGLLRWIRSGAWHG